MNSTLLNHFTDLDLKIFYNEFKSEECRKEAEKYKWKAENLRKKTKLMIIEKFRNRPLIGHRIGTLVDFELSANPNWKGYVSNNQWYMAQAAMYSNEAIMLRTRKLMSDNSDR